ncbi:HEPN domain-containing protein [Mycolicibacterium gilvum]|uniref:Uncharacterized protein n=1 Tax=Mycolicibacterium gilvum TaxID=1804 RepID=A0A378SR48_9MYCO|nr:HEPN domain-containing protein [Mycolicibacterium gilvum]MCV7057584.1 hypothetical protein [Mycolicibacterium gilvum]STZ44386.1 Uncharacterised protein [Mycolicibacterium gilvum]
MGHFWLPNDADNRQPGVLTYTPGDGLHLSLIGGYSDAAWIPQDAGTRQLTSRTRRWPIIHGHAENEPITLLHCAEERGQMAGTATAMYRQDMRAQQALFGIRIPAEDSPSFSSIEVEVENLTGWASEPDMTIEIDMNVPRSWRVQTELAASRFADIQGVTAELGRRYTVPDFDPRRGSLSFTGEAVSYIQFQSSEPRSLAYWRPFVNVVQDLISLAIDAPCGIVRQVLTPSTEIFEGSEANARIHLHTNELVVPQPTEPGVDAAEAIFTLKNIDFAHVLPKWFAVRQQFLATCNMVIGAMYLSDPGYLNSQVVTAVTAAEAMHRAFAPDPPIPTAEFKRLKNGLVDSLPEERRQWLREKLAHNDHTLRQRLDDLVSRPDSEVIAALLPNPQAWAIAATKARNGIAHEGHSEADLLLMHAVVTVTQAVVKMNLFDQLGIPTDRLRYALATNRNLCQAVRLACQHWPTIEEGA